MGDLAGVREALDRGRRYLDRVQLPVRSDNHFAIDPDKWEFYAMDAYRQAGDDDLAVAYATDVLKKAVGPDGTSRSPMRASEARMTVAIAATREGEMEYAMACGLAALNGPRKSLPSLLMIAGELDAELTRRWPAEDRIEDFRAAVRALH
jgi:hypothetical protein